MLDQRDHSRPETVGHHLRLFFTGFAMGAADIVPGVSGGTMAFILGIYHHLLDAIKSFNFTSIRMLLQLKLREFFNYVPLRFLIALGLGIGAAILLLSNVLSQILDDPQGRILLFAFFFGLVIASIVTVSAHVRWRLGSWLTLIIGTIVAFAIVNLVPASAAVTPLNMFLSGMIAICAMILPGISGSFILLILGQYDNVLNAVTNRDFATLGLVAAGCVVGIVLFSRVLSWLLKRFYHVTVAGLIGFMIGSLWKVWPWKECVLSDTDRHGELRCLIEQNLAPEIASEQFVIAVVLAALGFLLVSVLDQLQSGANPVLKHIFPSSRRVQVATSDTD